MYESPIEIMYGAYQSELNSSVNRLLYKAIQDVGIKVDKAELIRALIYDRQQYEKGFKEGVQAALEKVAAAAVAKDAEICLLHVMKWKDDGCCLDCVECVKKHSG